MLNWSLLLAALAGVVVLFVFASLNGITREVLVVKMVPRTAAVWLSMVLDIAAAWLICRVLLYSFEFEYSGADLWAMGLLWLTVGMFLELVVIGRLWARKDWDEMLAEFDPRTGSPNLLIPLTLLLMPVLVGSPAI